MAKKLLPLPAKRFPIEELASRTAVFAILGRHGMLARKLQRRRIGQAGKPTSAILAPNDVWSADFKGQLRAMYRGMVIDRAPNGYGKISNRFFDSRAFYAPGRDVDMNSSMSLRWPRWARVVAVVALVAAVIVGVPAVREPILRAVGWALVVKESVAPADIIVISLDAGGAGALEAADLVQSGIATQVAVFADPPSGEDYEFIRRGLPYEDQAARQIRQLELLGVRNIVRIPRIDAGTEGEGQVLPAWCDQHQFRSIVIVATTDHSRRLRRVLDRSMKGHPTSVAIQPSRYSEFDPDKWWETRGGIRTAIIELQKLLLDIVLHPASY